MKKPSKAGRIIIGVTGGIGSGKSTVAQMFADMGARVLDADRLAHTSYMPGRPAYRAIVRSFGRDVLRADGAIDRQRLGRKVFGDKLLLARLNAIVHKHVIKELREKIASCARGVVVLDAPLLIEAGMASRVDVLVVVKAARKLQIARAAKKTGLDNSEIIRRIKAQMPVSLKIRFGDFIIDNSGSRRGTLKQAGMIWKKVVLNQHKGGS